MRKLLLLSTLFLQSLVLSAQTNVRAWYADGQVWVVWEVQAPLPETYEVYARPTAFTNTATAIQLGRLFPWEYLAGALKEQVDSMASYRIPNGQGGMYQLAPNEGLFVATPHQAGQLYFAVVKSGETTVTAGVNITSAAVPFVYAPVLDPVECHLQSVFPSPFAPGFTCLAYYMWADGRQNQWENRPDFPVMANAAKNGMPSMFLISVPATLDTTQAYPLSVWLHGGGGTARQSLAGSRAVVGINPAEGILLAHNDDLMGYRSIVPPNVDFPSWHFGWRKNYDPFSPDNLPTAVDTIVNYTQRRYIWIDQWLIRHFNIDPTRINIHGHSMGSAGTTALSKCYPEHYGSATIFNNGFAGPEENSSLVTLGPSDQNFPTNVLGPGGETMHIREVFDITHRCSTARDLPHFRVYHSKNDDNGVMRWDSNVVANYRMADSLGWGMQLSWSERAHGIDTGPDYNDHWVQGIAANQQTAVDNVSYAELRFRSDQAFPAFFNNRLNPQSNDIGDGTEGTGPTVPGDDWGSWGGYHRWDWNDITDTPGEWSAVAWLESNAVFGNDNCPVNVLSSSFAIRRPQLFNPAAGKSLQWKVTEVGTGNVLQSGTTTVLNEDLVVIPVVQVYSENIRKVRITIKDQSVATEEIGDGLLREMQISPNPSQGAAVLIVNALRETPATVRVVALDGRECSFSTQLQQGQNQIELLVFDQLPAGFYFISCESEGGRANAKWVKM